MTDEKTEKSENLAGTGVSRSDGLPHREMDGARIAEAAAEAAVLELERTQARVYMLMGVVYGLLMAFYLVLLFSRREAV